MACTALLIWPEVVDDHEALLQCMTQPDFIDDSWAEWRFRVDGDASLLAAGCGALLSYTADGLPPEAIEWVSPEALLKAADRLMQLVEQDEPTLADAISEYEDCYGRGRPPEVALLEDLEVVRQKAIWAQGLGKTKVTFELEV
jgi:hypothetical protein